MALTVVEIHRAKQAGAEYGSESALWCHKAEAELARSRRLVFRERYEEAAEAARLGQTYAQKAHSLARLPARVWQVREETLATIETRVALLPE